MLSRLLFLWLLLLLDFETSELLRFVAFSRYRIRLNTCTDVTFEQFSSRIQL